MFQANYTYGHALDEVSNGGLEQFASRSSVYSQDANNLRGSYAAADYDARHSFNANYVWEVPVKEVLRGHGPDSLVKGWQLTGAIIAKPNPGAVFVQTGCETGFNTGNLPGPKGPCSGPLVTSAQGRNRYRGPSYADTDFAVMKNTKIPHWETGVLTIGFQFFNLFNHANFGFPDNWSSDNTFGQILYQEQAPTSVLGSGLNANVSGRMIQVKAQIQF